MPDAIDTDKFISFSAKQNKNFDTNRSPVKLDVDGHHQINNYYTEVKYPEPKSL
jgi:hypothetical protein